MLNSTVGAFCNIILQILWIFRLLYDSIIPDNKSLGEEPKQHQLTDESNKRHLIHLITTPNHRNNNGRPICYMQVCELLTAEEEMLRCVCAKGYTNNHQTVIKNNRINQPFTWFNTFPTLTV